MIKKPFSFPTSICRVSAPGQGGFRHGPEEDDKLRIRVWTPDQRIRIAQQSKHGDGWNMAAVRRGIQLCNPPLPSALDMHLQQPEGGCKPCATVDRPPAGSPGRGYAGCEYRFVKAINFNASG